MSRRGTFAVAIVATSSLEEILRFALQAALGFPRPHRDTGDPEPDPTGQRSASRTPFSTASAS